MTSARCRWLCISRVAMWMQGGRNRRESLHSNNGCESPVQVARGHANTTRAGHPSPLLAIQRSRIQGRMRFMKQSVTAAASKPKRQQNHSSPCQLCLQQRPISTSRLVFFTPTDRQSGSRGERRNLPASVFCHILRLFVVFPRD